MSNTKPALLTASPVKLITPRPKLKSAPPPMPTPDHAKHLAEYETLAKQVGMKAPLAEVEAFRIFLMQHQITIFGLEEVIKYMDAKAKTESDNGGWLWRPLRNKDNIDFRFGKEASRDDYNRMRQRSSDYFRHGQDSYQHTIPLHALRKVAHIEKNFKRGKVAFMVSDYAPKPAIRYPDPFLMVVVPNPEVRLGTGRFVIDFWEEPGFGLAQQFGITKHLTKKSKK